MRHWVFNSPAQFPSFLAVLEEQAPVYQPECLIVSPVDTGKKLAHLGFVLVKPLRPDTQRFGSLQAAEPPVITQYHGALRAQQRIVRRHQAAGKERLRHPAVGIVRIELAG